MKLNMRIALLALIMLVMYIALDYIIQQKYIIPTYLRLEEQETKENLDRCAGTMKVQFSQLFQFARDWASWDDTYTFAEDRNQTYIDSNLALTWFENSHLNVIFYVGPDGQFIWGKVYDIQKKEVIHLPEFPETTWEKTNPLLATIYNEQSHVTGLMQTSRGTMMVTSHPILNSMERGPIRGYLIMGRFLDEKMLQSIEEQIQVKFHIYNLDKDAIPRNYLQHAPAQMEPGMYVLAPRNRLTYEAYSIMNDISGKPIFLLQCLTPRDILFEGQNSIAIAKWIYLSGSIVIISLLLVVLQRLVVKPIQRLTRYVTAVNKADDIKPLQIEYGNDEIGVLCREYNQMAERLIKDRLENQQTALALAESEIRMRSIFDTAPDGILTIASTGSIDSVNTAAAMLFGYSADEILGKSIELILPDFEMPTGSKTQGIVHAPQVVEVEGLRKDGILFPVYLSSQWMKIQNDLFLTIIVHDMTELHQMQEKVSRTERLAALGEMGATVAHEIRNPLTGISGVLQVLRGTFTQGDYRHQAVVEALEQITRVDNTVRQLLALSKPWTPQKEPCNIVSLVQSVADEMIKQTTIHAIHIEPPEEDFLTELEIDPAHIRQVMINIIKNAMEAMPDGGDIQVSFERTDQSFCILIHDQGSGIPEDLIAKLFNPFYTMKTHGIGLGLSICKSIMEAHQGFIGIANDPQGGACVILKFPEA